MADPVHFEARHRKLREALNADLVRRSGAGALLRAFELRAGPLVDDVIAAVRRDHELADELIDSDGAHAAMLANQRVEVRGEVRRLLAALDEEARR